MSGVVQSVENGVSTVISLAVLGVVGAAGYFIYKTVKGFADLPKQAIEGLKQVVGDLPANTKQVFENYSQHPVESAKDSTIKYFTSNWDDFKSITTDFSIGHAAKWWLTHLSPIGLPYQTGRALGFFENPKSRATGGSGPHPGATQSKPPEPEKNFFEKAKDTVVDKFKSIFSFFD